MKNFTVASCVATCIVIFTLYSIVQRYRRRRNLYKLASKLPGPPTLPIIGNASIVIGSHEDIFNRMVELPKLYPNTPLRLWLCNYFIVGINTPEQLKVVLLSPKTIDKPKFVDMARPWLGTGLFTACGPKWQVHRKLIQPTFSLTIVNSFAEIFAARTLIMAEEMERNLDGPEFNIHDYVSQCALYTICDTTMGVKLDTVANGDRCYADTIKEMITGLSRRMFTPWLHPDFIFYRTQFGKKLQKHIKFLHSFTDNVIQAKRKVLQQRRDRPDLDDNQEDIGCSRKKIFLDHLLEMAGHDNQILSNEAVRAEVDTMMIAGSDTTAVIISFVMLMLASHPEIQEKAYQELCEIYQDRDIEEVRVTPRDLTRMAYMERVIKETMRLFPATPLLVRMATDDLDIGEHTVPAESIFLLSIIDLHRNEDIWPDPLKFDPDRFLPEEVKKRHSYSYLPFSGGPRNCIGSKYAMMLMKTLVATVLQRYVLKKDDVIPVKDIRLKWEFLLRPVEPITLKIERRSREDASI